MTATLETNVVYECDAPLCGRKYYVKVPDAESSAGTSARDYADEYLPIGWALVKVNPKGSTIKRRRWVICSPRCMAEALDEGIESSITEVML